MLRPPQKIGETDLFHKEIYRDMAEAIINKLPVDKEDLLFQEAVEKEARYITYIYQSPRDPAIEKKLKIAADRSLSRLVGRGCEVDLSLTLHHNESMLRRMLSKLINLVPKFKLKLRLKSKELR